MNELEITFPLEKAVIYPKCAGLTRAREIQFQTGENRMLIRDLPEAITEDSIRMELLPQSRLKIQEVYSEDKILPAYDENRYRKNRQELEALLHTKRKLEAAYKNYLDEFMLFYNKESLAGNLEKQLHKPLFADNWDAFFIFVEEKLKSNRDKAREILFSWLSLQREIEAGEANLRKYSGYEQVKEHRIVAIIQAPDTIQEIIRLYYLQEGVQWHPAYRIRADIVQKGIAVSLYSIISQNTGEDWKDISIELSTAVPMVNCDIPAVFSRLIQERSAEIITTKADEARKDLAMDLDDAACDEILAPPEPKMMARKKASFLAGISGKMDKGGGAVSSNLAAMSKTRRQTADSPVSASPQPPPVEKPEKRTMRSLPVEGQALFTELVTGVEKELLPGGALSGLSHVYRDFYTYMNLEYTPESRLPGTVQSGTNPFFARGISPLSSLGGYDYRYKVTSRKNFIPCLNSPIQLGVDIRELPMDLVYITMPYAAEDVYLKARFVNQGSSPLPAGPAQVFVENTFIGNVNFPTLGRFKGTALSLGIEKDIKVKRTANSKRRTTGLVAKGILVDFEIEIELTSFKTEQVSIEIYDRLPVSRMSKEIPVQDESFEPAPWKITDDKILIWKIQADPGKKQFIKFHYTIKHPENYQLELTESGTPFTDEEI